MSENFLSGLAASFSSGYGHSGHGHSGYGHSGYGHSGYGHSGSGYGGNHKDDHYGGHSGHSGYGHDDKCCPLVVDFLCLAAILGAIAGASILLARVIQIEITGRRKRSLPDISSLPFKSYVLGGKHQL